MRSVILRTAARHLLALMVLFSLFLLVRGHHAPGGGFAGGLVAGTAYGLYAYAYDGPSARELLHVDPRSLVGTGFLIVLLAAVLPLASGHALLTGLWVEVPLGPLGSPAVGTPLLFDVGVYLTVLGMSTSVLLAWEGA